MKGDDAGVADGAGTLQLCPGRNADEARTAYVQRAAVGYGQRRSLPRSCVAVNSPQGAVDVQGRAGSDLHRDTITAQMLVERLSAGHFGGAVKGQLLLPKVVGQGAGYQLHARKRTICADPIGGASAVANERSRQVDRTAIFDSRTIRTSALAARINTITTIAGAEAAVQGIACMDNINVYDVQSLHTLLH